MPTPTDPIVGIDLGTTYSLVALCDERGPRIIPDEQGRALLPSVVRYEFSAPPANAGDTTGSAQPRITVGWDAKEQQAQHPFTTIFSVKRLMGRSLQDASPDLAFLPYRVVAGEHNTARVAVPVGASPDTRSAMADGPSRILSPQEVSAAILRHLKDQAARALGIEVRRAVVTVPAYFDDAQRQATRDAGRLAGLEVVRIVNEPTGAALAYGLGLHRASDRNQPETSTVAVYDLGGGTFDVSILRLTPAQAEGETSFFQVLATAGDTHLGGDDIDNAIADLVLRAHKLDRASLAPAAVSRLKQAAERAKRELSDQDETTLSVRLNDSPDGSQAASIAHTLTRAALEALIEPLAARSLAACDRALRDARKQLGPPTATTPSGLDAVVLVGGSTRIPLIRRRVAEFFGLTPYIALDPDQVVALGAAVQASILSGQSKNALLLDVIPLALGLETVGGAVAKLIMRNTTVPARAAEMFSTSIDNQTSIKLHILQGEREMAADCRSLGEFHLRGLPPMPAGIPQVEVTFLIDANGVLNVSAVERRSGKRAAIQIIPNHGLTREEVDRMEAESYLHAREDMARHRVVDLIANSKLDLKWINDRFRALADKLDAGYRASLAARIDELAALTVEAEKDWRAVNPDRFHRTKEALDRESVRLHEISIAESLKGTGS